MPITLRLSREFYERFGDQAVNEFVGALNQVDLAYRDTFHELSEANLGRLDDKLAGLGAELRGEMDRRFAELRGDMDSRFAEFRGEMQAGFAKADAKLEQRVGELRAELQAVDARVDARLERLRADLVKWMFLFWAGTALTVIGVLKF